MFCFIFQSFGKHKKNNYWAWLLVPDWLVYVFHIQQSLAYTQNSVINKESSEWHFCGLKFLVDESGQSGSSHPINVLYNLGKKKSVPGCTAHIEADRLEQQKTTMGSMFLYLYHLYIYSKMLPISIKAWEIDLDLIIEWHVCFKHAWLMGPNGEVIREPLPHTSI